MLKFRELKQIGPTVIRSWLIGNIIGILPGAGASIACFLGYNTAKQFSKSRKISAAAPLKASPVRKRQTTLLPAAPSFPH